MRRDAEVLAADAAAVRASGIANQHMIEAETLAAINATETAMLGLALGGLATAWFTGNAISSPVLNITAAIDRLASDDLNAEVPAIDRGDEVGRMAQVMLDSLQNAQEVRRLQGEAACACRERSASTALDNLRLLVRARWRPATTRWTTPRMTATSAWLSKIPAGQSIAGGRPSLGLIRRRTTRTILSESNLRRMRCRFGQRLRARLARS